NYVVNPSNSFCGQSSCVLGQMCSCNNSRTTLQSCGAKHKEKNLSCGRIRGWASCARTALKIPRRRSPIVRCLKGSANARMSEVEGNADTPFKDISANEPRFPAVISG